MMGTRWVNPSPSLEHRIIEHNYSEGSGKKYQPPADLLPIHTPGCPPPPVSSSHALLTNYIFILLAEWMFSSGGFEPDHLDRRNSPYKTSNKNIRNEHTVPVYNNVVKTIMIEYEIGKEHAQQT